MYQEILYEIVIFDHILGEGGWYMAENTQVVEMTVFRHPF